MNGQKSSAATTRRRKTTRGSMFSRKKGCKFCADNTLVVDYKDVRQLRGFTSETGAITPRRVSGACSKHQRKLAEAIKRARNLALLPFADRGV